MNEDDKNKINSFVLFLFVQRRKLCFIIIYNVQVCSKVIRNVIKIVCKYNHSLCLITYRIYFFFILVSYQLNNIFFFLCQRMLSLIETTHLFLLKAHYFPRKLSVWSFSSVYTNINMV